MGHIFWLLILSCQWSYDRPWYWNIWWIKHPLTTKRLRVELNLKHNMRVRALYCQFCWDSVPSKLTTHRHYRLLRTRSWSHRISKLICWQLREKCKVKWICLWTKSCYQLVEERRAPLSELSCLKIDIWLMYPWSKCTCPRIGKEYITCCAPVLVEVDRELRSRSKAYLLTHLILTYLVPVAWIQTWVSQPNHVQLLQVGGFDDEWHVGASTPTLDMGNPKAKQIRSWFFIA